MPFKTFQVLWRGQNIGFGELGSNIHYSKTFPRHSRTWSAPFKDTFITVKEAVQEPLSWVTSGVTGSLNS